MVLVLVVLIGFVGLALDVAYGVLVGGQLQNAADAASLAGVRLIRADLMTARQAAQSLALANDAATDPVQLALNEANAADGDIVIGRYDRATDIFTPTLTNPNAVKVVARRTGDALGGPLPLIFAPIFGIDTINLERTAIAMIGGGTGAGMIALEETDKWTFRLGGNTTLKVYDTSVPGGEGAIQVNSDNPGALRTDGFPTLVASEINVHASYVDDPPVFDGEVNTNRPRVEDPLASLVPPDNWGTNRGTFSATTGETYTLQPGYYPDGISMAGGTVNLDPGIYVLDGVGLNITGGDLHADGVMFYIVDTTPSDSTKSFVNLTGNGVMRITPMPIEQDPYGGIAIWQASDNTNGASLRGTNEFEGIDGTVYFPTAHVDITGTSDSFGIRQLISNTVNITGAGTLEITYDGRFPAPGSAAFLVN